MKRFLALAGFAAALAFPVAASAQTATVAEKDKTFLMQNQQTNLAEISLGKVVAERTTNEAVKALANHVVEDHQMVSQQNMDLAKRLGVTLPTEPNATQKAMAQSVMAKSGTAFDMAYAKGEVEGHTTSISQTKAEMSSGTNADVKAFATDYLPKAQEHLDQARSVNSQLSSASAGAPALPRTGTPIDVLAGAGFVLLLTGTALRRTQGRRTQPASAA
jgi:putative membrane protein